MENNLKPILVIIGVVILIVISLLWGMTAFAYRYGDCEMRPNPSLLKCVMVAL